MGVYIMLMRQNCVQCVSELYLISRVIPKYFIAFSTQFVIVFFKHLCLQFCHVYSLTFVGIDSKMCLLKPCMAQVPISGLSICVRSGKVKLIWVKFYIISSSTFKHGGSRKIYKDRSVQASIRIIENVKDSDAYVIQYKVP